MSKSTAADVFRKETRGAASGSNTITDPSLYEEPRILVVDNDQNTTRLIKALLETRGGYVVFEENESRRAHQAAREIRPDVILLDIMMPEIDGGEVAEQIEGDPELRGTPIIFLTALVTKNEAENGLEIQGHSFLAKPINIPNLISGINRQLLVSHASTTRNFLERLTFHEILTTKGLRKNKAMNRQVHVKVPARVT